MNNIIKLLEEYKDKYDNMDLINDIFIINNAIECNSKIKKESVYDSIYNKYKKELDEISELEKKYRSENIDNFYNNNPVVTIDMHLANLRHALARVGIKRLLDKNIKEYIKSNIVDNNDLNVYAYVVSLLKND